MLVQERAEGLFGTEEREGPQRDDGGPLHQIGDDGLMPVADRTEPFEIAGPLVDRLLRERLGVDSREDGTDTVDRRHPEAARPVHALDVRRDRIARDTVDVDHGSSLVEERDGPASMKLSQSDGGTSPAAGSGRRSTRTTLASSFSVERRPLRPP